MDGACLACKKGKAVIQFINLQDSSLVVNLRQTRTFAKKGYFQSLNTCLP